jgi:hypothetical protein
VNAVLGGDFYCLKVDSYARVDGVQVKILKETTFYET